MNELIRLYDYIIFEGMCYALWQHYSSDISIVDKNIIKTTEEQGILVKALKYYIDVNAINTSNLSIESWYHSIDTLLK